MDNFDLAAALRHFRVREALSLEEIACKLNVSRSAYYRLESGAVTPSYKKAQEIRKLLKMEESTAAKRKWYKSRKLRWVIPVLIAYLALSLLPQLVGFRDGYGEDNLNNFPSTIELIVLGVPFFGLYWYYYPPEWPFKKSRK